MNLQKNQKGFIFSLDATLGLLVTLVALVGIAQVGSSSISYKQYGYTQLESYANDGLRVLSLSGTIDNAIRLVENHQNEEAREILRENLSKILPKEIQFKLIMGQEDNVRLNNVYPGTDNLKWENAFTRAKEKVAASRVTAKRLVPFNVLVWVEDDFPETWWRPNNQTEKIENFVEEIRKPSWNVRTTSDETEFRNYLLGNKDWVPDVVFIPDSGEFDYDTLDAILYHYGIRNGGVVAGGAFLWWNGGYDFPFFGLLWDYSRDWDPPHQMQITNQNYPITATAPEYVEYVDGDGYGDEYPVYTYQPLPSYYEESEYVDYLASWPGTSGWREVEDFWWGETWDWYENNYVGLTARRETEIGENRYNRTSLFNAFPAQSAMEGEGTKAWTELAQRAVEWCGGATLRFEPIKLYVWRGEAVE